MPQRQLAAVLFTVAGIYVAVSHLPSLLLNAIILAKWSLVTSGERGVATERIFVVASVVTQLIQVLIGVALVRMRDEIASMLFPASSEAVRAPELHAVALSVLGAYFVVNGVQQFIDPRTLQWGGVVQIVLGIGLFLGARSITAYWSRFREATGPIRYD